MSGRAASCLAGPDARTPGAATMSLAMIHLSIPIADVEASARFYGDLLGCPITRLAANRIDIAFFGHHLVAQLAPAEAAYRGASIGDDPFPIRHFGIIVTPEAFAPIAARLAAGGAKVAFGPSRIFAGTAREQEVLIVNDPSGNAIEIKSIGEPRAVFA